MKLKLFTSILVALFFLTSASSKETHPDDDLLNAIAQGNLTFITQKLKNGVNVNAVHDDGSNYGTTLICSASCSGNIDIISVLLDFGAEVTLEMEHRHDALKESIQCGSTHVVNWLLNTGLYNHLHEEELIALLYLPIFNDDINTFNILLNRTKSLQNVQGYTNLLFSTAINDRIRLFEHLVDLGADIGAFNENGDGVIHLAANSASILNYLIKQRLDVNTRSNNGCTPLHRSENEEATQLLINSGADIEARDNLGWTPLHYAALDGDFGVMLQLLQNGAKVNAKTKQTMETIHPGLSIKSGSNALDIAYAAINYHKEEKKIVKYEKIINMLRN